MILRRCVRGRRRGVARLIYLQTESVTIHRTDAQIDAGARFLEKSDASICPPHQRGAGRAIREGSTTMPFFRRGVWITGNFRALPDTMKPDGPPVELDSDGAGGTAGGSRPRLSPALGEILAVGRDIGQFIALRDILLQALLLSGALVIVLASPAARPSASRPFVGLGSCRPPAR